MPKQVLSKRKTCVFVVFVTKIAVTSEKLLSYFGELPSPDAGPPLFLSGKSALREILRDRRRAKTMMVARSVVVLAILASLLAPSYAPKKAAKRKEEKPPPRGKPVPKQHPEQPQMEQIREVRKTRTSSTTQHELVVSPKQYIYAQS